MSEPVVLARVDTERGELVLRQVGDHFEIVSNGVFLMDTRNGESERLLVRAALDRHPTPRDLLIGGLGVGFTVEEASHDDRPRSITVAEISPEIVGWNARHFRQRSDDGRVTILTADLLEHLRRDDSSYDVICLDIDNGPEWTVTNSNRSLYNEAGTALVARRLRPGGVLTVWSASRSVAYEAVLSRHFSSVEILEVEVPRGEPDVIMIARDAP